PKESGTFRFDQTHGSSGAKKHQPQHPRKSCADGGPRPGRGEIRSPQDRNKLFDGASAHQRNEPATAADFELAEDCVKVLFHHWQTQAGVISDLLITPPFTHKPGNFLLAARKPYEMGQTGARRPGAPSSLTAQVFALDKKMRPRYAS